LSQNIIASAYDSGGSSSSEVQRIIRVYEAHKSERSTWDPTLRDISDFIAPRRGRFFLEDRNKGDRKDRRIINNRPTRAARVLTAGLMSYLTNPAQPWLRFTTPDPKLNEFEPVKEYLALLVERVQWVFHRSNFYQALHGFYADLLFGTAAMHIDEDPERIICCYLYPIGSYVIANGANYKVNTLYREFQMTAPQLVERFGPDKVSKRCLAALKESRNTDWFTVLHALEPNVDLETGKLGHRGMPFKSRWLERGPDESKGFLAEGGFQEWPAPVARWDATGEDVWGNGPGHEAIGDARALQTLERRKAQFIDHLARPGMQFPSTMRQDPVSGSPGSHVFVDASGPAQQVRPIYEANPVGLQVIEASIREHEKRIDQAMRADLWLVMEQLVEGKMTATEVVQRRHEKGLQMGPTLHRLEMELLNPVIDRVVPIMFRRGLMPPPPDELQGMELRAEFISVLAQAQKLVGIQGVQELARMVGLFAQMQLSGKGAPVLDKFDFDQAVDAVSDMLATPPAITISDDEVESVRAQRAQAEAAAQRAAAVQQAAETAKTASETDLEGDNVLSRMLPAIAGDRA